jgi:RNA polymerase sigma-70 factor (ECF subfamily)
VEPTADALTERLRAGDTSAVGEYVESHRLQLLAYISRRMGGALRTRIESEDVLQDLTVDAIRRLPDIADRSREPFAWMCQLAEHRLIDAHRKLFGAQKRSADREVGLDARGNDGAQSPLMNLLVASMTTASQVFSRNVREQALLEALETLPPESRDALRMRYVEGLASREIAERLGKSDVAVRVLLSRSLARLQAVFDGSPPR